MPLLVLTSPNTLRDRFTQGLLVPFPLHSLKDPFSLTLNTPRNQQFPNSHPFLGLVPQCHTRTSTQLPPKTPQASLPLHGSCLPAYPASTFSIMVAGSSLPAGAQGHQQCLSISTRSLANSSSMSLSAAQVRPHRLPPGPA